MADKKRAIKVDTLDRLAEGFQESRGITHKLTTEEMIELAKVPTASGENKLAQFVDGTLTEITAEDFGQVTVLKDSLFKNQKNLISVIMSNSIESTGESVFEDCSELTSVTLSNSIKSMGEGLFRNCRKLANVTIPYGVTVIGSRTFNTCYGLKKINIPNSVTKIGPTAFGSCGINTPIIIPNSVTEIGDYAFQYCYSSIIRIGNGITSIGIRTFVNSSVKDIYIDKAEESVSGAPWGATNATVHWNTPLPSEEV